MVLRKHVNDEDNDECGLDGGGLNLGGYIILITVHK